MTYHDPDDSKRSYLMRMGPELGPTFYAIVGTLDDLSSAKDRPDGPT
jgi:hypothetical protein